MTDNVIYMDDWLRTHGRSVPMSQNGVQLNWLHTDQAFDADEMKAMDAAMSNATIDWPWNK